MTAAKGKKMIKRQKIFVFRLADIDTEYINGIHDGKYGLQTGTNI